ncbi:hypothetical protein Glove_84g44 [Diversispora epigaea]|uniref:Uncharacterized protein n=1 Tax=Diversispora epigaea TaxID=1348612 RepID=A0A397JGZ2_9GLOM|nr:hypothetical protein Glove_84g44 [Diversispora epigaea]
MIDDPSEYEILNNLHRKIMDNNEELKSENLQFLIYQSKMNQIILRSNSYNFCSKELLKPFDEDEPGLTPKNLKKALV